MMRSSSGRSPPRPSSARSPRFATSLFCCLTSFESALCLATMPPCDDNAEENMEHSESERHKRVSPRRRQEERGCARDHKADPHYGNYFNRKRPSRYAPCAVEKNPHSGTSFYSPASEKARRQQRAHKHGRSETERNFPPRRQKERHAHTLCFSVRRPPAYEKSRHSLCKPYREP